MAIRELNSAIITLTQGGADAFVQGSVATNLANSGYAWNLVRARFMLRNPGTIMAATGADFEISTSVTRRSKAAIPNLADVDVITAYQRMKIMDTAVGFVIADLSFKEEYEPPIVLPEETIYAQLDSTGSGLTLVGDWKLEYELVKISEVDRLTILARSLTV